MPIKAPAPPPPMYDWTGFYVGLQGGYGWGWPEFDLPFPTFMQQAWPANGLFGGAMAGYNYEFGASHIVLGVEGEYSAGDLSGNVIDTFGFSHTATVKNIGSIDARFGLALTGMYWDHMMLYLIGGAAFGDPTQTFTTPLGTASFDGGDHDGWDFGSGIEVAVADHWTVRGEWRMYGFTSASLPLSPVLPGIHFGAKETINVARAGVAYKF